MDNLRKFEKILKTNDENIKEQDENLVSDSSDSDDKPFKMTGSFLHMVKKAIKTQQSNEESLKQLELNAANTRKSSKEETLKPFNLTGLNTRKSFQVEPLRPSELNSPSRGTLQNNSTMKNSIEGKSISPNNPHATSKINTQPLLLGLGGKIPDL